MRWYALFLLTFFGCSQAYDTVPAVDDGGPSAPSDAGPAATCPPPPDAGLPPAPPAGLADSVVVCRTCSPELLAAKTRGILDAMAMLRAYAGADVLPQLAPVTFHLDGDDVCGSAADMITRYGFLTGFTTSDAAGRAHVCLFDVEKTNRMLPFTPQNAVRIADQLLPVHEAGHAWFAGREGDYAVQEPFVKMASFVVSGTLPDPCRDFRVTAPPDRLIADLCDAGMTTADIPDIFRATASAARDAGRPLTNAEFVATVSSVLGHDVSAAFTAAGVAH